MKTDNELIAEFCGRKYGVNADKNGYLKYDTSWDHLMPVVEKIAEHIYEEYPDHNGYKEVVVKDRAYTRTFGMIDSDGKWMVRINRMPLEQEDTLIQATYNAVVEWIKWHNEQK